MKGGMRAFAALIAAGLSPCLVIAANADEIRPMRVGPEQIWRSSCGYCHGGAAGAPELRGLGLPPSVIEQFARQGAPGMPPFHESEISDADLKRLAEWISAQPKPRRQP
jgi:mono/diheme cytochrome c family protein